MEVYRFQQSRNKKKLLLFIFLYVLLVCIRILTVHFVAEVVQENNKYGESFFTERKQQKQQKVLVMRRLLMQRISSKGFTFAQEQFKQGDIVYVRLPYPNSKKGWKQRIQNILHIVSLGIVRNPYANSVFRKVIAVPGDQVTYNTSKVVSINGPSVHFIDDNSNDIPLFDHLKSVTLEEDEYFLLGVEEYALDGTLFGATPKGTIKGKSIILLGPVWGLIGEE